MEKKISSLKKLIEALNPDFKDVEVYTQAMRSLKLSVESIQNHCSWREDFYTRNLVKKTKAYELMVLCWPSHQTSPIHNHQGQDCWMHVISGEITEIQYHCLKDEDSGAWRIKEGDRLTCRPSETAYINDKICLHQICNNSDQPAITLHLYSYPIETCNIYCCKTGKVTSRKLSYSSVDEKAVIPNTQ
ncbi:cysteine dioxygenase family protein [Candidatus Uabimicrobium sp. HlEnr_7]|uniref:cysteine dioxygenase n=1 Tax=Candidatus Uabimicrobium helgolandensis TaxID=3095367 RepID=UPI00355632B0